MILPTPEPPKGGFFLCQGKTSITGYLGIMAKTTFGSGVIATSQFLNGAKQIYFDGQDLDWHYNPLGLNSMVTMGPNGLDSRYLTLSTNQPTLSSLNEFISGAPISGSKVTVGKWWFGFPTILDENNNNVNPENVKENAPRSYTTNDKYNYANGVAIPSVAQKFASLNDADLVTKKILSDLLNSLVIDNGQYE